MIDKVKKPDYYMETFSVSESPPENQEEKLINEIFELFQQSSQLLQNLTLKETSEVKISLPPSELLIPLFSAFFIAISDEDQATPASIRKRLRNPQEFLTKIKNLHIPNDFLPIPKIHQIKSIYDSHPGLTESLQPFSRYCHALSKWTESLIEISLKFQNLLQLQSHQPKTSKN